MRKVHKEKESDVQISLDFESETLDRTRLRQLFVDITLDFERESLAAAAGEGTAAQ